MSVTKWREWAEEKYGAEKVSAKMMEIVVTLGPEDQKTKKMETAHVTTLGRLEMLRNNNLNLEYLNMGGQLIEYAIKRVITAREFAINHSLLIGDFDTKLKVGPSLGARTTLGPLIDKFKGYYGQETEFSDLVAKLDIFLKQRNDATHNAYEKFQDINAVNEEVKAYVKSDPVPEMVGRIAEIHQSVVAELIRKLKEYDPEISFYPVEREDQ